MPAVLPGMAASCAGCGGHITDRYYLLAVDRAWHVACLRCSECKGQLETALSCFVRGGNIYCKDDYYRLFALQRCARCLLNIAPNELVMRAREHVFHLGCFTCSTCDKALVKGEHFGLRDKSVYCRVHYQATTCQSGLPTAGLLTHDDIVPTKWKTKKKKGEGREAPPIPRTASSTRGHRPKRLRTSFKHQQLRTMKSYFTLNHNPDSKDLKLLSQKTGLSKRVLQVWFQNARAKFRRNLLRQQLFGPEIAEDSRPLEELVLNDSLFEPLPVKVVPTPITMLEQSVYTFPS